MTRHEHLEAPLFGSTSKSTKWFQHQQSLTLLMSVLVPACQIGCIEIFLFSLPFLVKKACCNWKAWIHLNHQQEDICVWRINHNFCISINCKDMPQEHSICLHLTVSDQGAWNMDISLAFCSRRHNELLQPVARTLAVI